MGNPRRHWFDYLTRTTWRSTGVNDAWLLEHHSIARGNSDESPYLIPNEWICGRIASFLGLPVPPFFLTRKGATGKRLFASLRFGGRDSRPDDTAPEVLFSKYPEMCSGVLLFDILVANSDRHRGNVQVDSPTNPRDVWVFDHDRALFGKVRRQAARRLGTLRNRLGISGGSATGENRHCLIDVINTTEHFATWIDKIGRMPEYFIRDTCSHVIGVGVGKTLADKAFDFINERRQDLRSIIMEHKLEFTAIPSANWPLLL